MVRQLEVERSGVMCAATASASDNGEVVGSAAEPDVAAAAAAAAAADVGLQRKFSILPWCTVLHGAAVHCSV